MKVVTEVVEDLHNHDEHVLLSSCSLCTPHESHEILLEQSLLCLLSRRELSVVTWHTKHQCLVLQMEAREHEITIVELKTTERA